MRLSLHRQAFLFFVLFELGMLVLFGSLLNLQRQAEEESVREETAKRIIGETQQLAFSFQQAGQGVAEYCKTRDPAWLAKFDEATTEIPLKCAWLREQFKNDPRQAKIFEHLNANCMEMLASFTETRKALETRSTLDALPLILRAREKAQPGVNSLVKDGLALVEQQKAIVDESPERDRQRRETSRYFVFYGFLGTTVLALLALLGFLKSVIARLRCMEENTHRLATDKPLLPRLQGGDEIAHLDSVFHDMAGALKEAQAAERAYIAKIEESEQRTRSIIEGLNASLIVTDQNGRIDFINAATSQMFGYTSEEIIGTQLSSLLPPGKGSNEEEHTHNLIKRALGHIVEQTARKRDGNDFPVEVTLSPCEFAEGSRLVANILDITERHEIQKMRQAFVAMVSHDLRSPLTSVQGYLELMEMGAFGEVSQKAQRGAERAHNSVTRLIKLINDLLDLEKMESGTIALTLVPMKMSRLIDDSVEAVRVLAEKQNVLLVAADTEGLEVVADYDRLVQVLVNLLSNAIKFSPPDASVEINIRDDSQWVELRIKDYGRGVPAKYREVIFEKFQQVEESDNKKKGGTGLGLPICKSIIEQHGGSIGVDSEEGKGSEFWFRLPKQGVVSNTVQQSDLMNTLGT